jgi:hypothetical protein
MEEICNNCRIEEAVTTFEKGNYHINVCNNCFEIFIGEVIALGVDGFIRWGFRSSYDDESVINYSYDVFGKESTDKALLALDELLPMFTFGILKYPHNIEEEGGINIVENSTLSGYIMYATNGTNFPVTEFTGLDSDIIYGTYFEVPAHVVFGSYDAIEGYDPNNNPEYNMYNRKLVSVKLPSGEIKEANKYIANPSYFIRSMIPEYQIMTGNYDDKDTHLRLILDCEKEDE